VTERLVDHLARFDSPVEVGIGRRPDVAAALADRGCTVTATDIHDRSTPDAVAFVREDVTDPTPEQYAGADLVYALNCPPELQRPARDLARRLDVPFLFTTLGADPATVPATPTTLADATLFRAAGRGPALGPAVAGPDGGPRSRRGGESP
jgi:uncharacterized UPF0146 family protein